MLSSVKLFSIMFQRTIGTISGLFAADLNQEALFVCGTSGRPELNKYHEDRYSTSDKSNVILDLKALARLYLLIPGANVYSPCRADTLLLRHWSRKLCSGRHISYKYMDIGVPIPHVVNFPLSYLPKNLHWIDPDLLFELHSKRFIPQIPCPQAAVLEESDVTFPCVVKMCRSQGGRGTFIVRTRTEYCQKLDWIKENMPNAETIINEYIEEDHGYGVHIYLHKAGSITPIGVDIPEFDDEMKFIGAMCFYDDQERLYKLLAPSIEPVFQTLHEKGYFGLVSLDVILDKVGKQYVVDLNPRSSSMQMVFDAAPLMAQRGYNVGILRRAEMSNCNLLQFFDRIDKISEQIRGSWPAGDNRTYKEMSSVHGVDCDRFQSGLSLIDQTIVNGMNITEMCLNGVPESRTFLRESVHETWQNDGKRTDEMTLNATNNGCPTKRTNDINTIMSDNKLVHDGIEMVTKEDCNDLEKEPELKGDLAIFAAKESGDGSVMFLVGVYANSIQNCQKILKVGQIVPLVYN